MQFDDSLSSTLQRALEASGRNDVEAAVRLLQQAGAETPSSPLPQFLLAAEYAQAGRLGEAEAAYANAVLLGPGLHIARFELGTLQFTTGRAALALVTWQPLLELPDTDPLRLFVRGYAELAQNAFQSALDNFAAGLAANRNNDALNSNIRLLMTEIAKELSAASGVAPAAVATDPLPDGAGTHFLVSNYGRQGSLH